MERRDREERRAEERRDLSTAPDLFKSGPERSFLLGIK